jgi:hypothetical protein
MMKVAQFKDLADLAIDRCRDSAMSVGQLMEDDHERAALLMSVANDMIEGAANLIEESDDKISEDEALAAVITLMFKGIGAERLRKALSHGPHLKKKEAGK